MTEIRGRLAPSPTGAQHLGNARTYLVAWLMARKINGSTVLRIEDIDSPRIKPWAVPQAIEDLHWLGLDWDDEPYTQSARMSDYREALMQLRKLNLIYPCTCSRSDIEAAASAPHLEHEGPVYPGTCAHRQADDIPDRPFAWRFRVSDTPAFHDLFRGDVALDLTTLGGDFGVWKNDDTPAYQLAVVVDDAAQGITQVIRGDDLIPSTPRQLLLFDALTLKAPAYGHLPLVVGPDGRRLAKRHGDTRLSTLREQGITAEQVIGLLAHSLGWLPQPQRITARELIPLARWETIPPQPWVFHMSSETFAF